MDSSFTEHILERARERQKKLKQLNSTEQLTFVEREKIVTDNTKLLSSSTSTDDNQQKTFTVQETGPSTPKKLNSEGRVKQIIRHNSATKISSQLPASPEIKTLNIQKDNFNMEIKLMSSDNVRVEVEIQESDSSDIENTLTETNSGENKTVSGLREHAKHKLNKLGRLYAGGEDANISSPIYRTEENFLTGERVSKEKFNDKETNKLVHKKGLNRLVKLAEDIKQWDDDTTKVSTNRTNISNTPVRKWQSPTPAPLQSKNGNLEEACAVIKNKNMVHSPTKQNTAPNTESHSISTTSHNLQTDEATLDLNQDVLKTLEMQGFTRTTSNSRLIYNYNIQKNKEASASGLQVDSLLKQKTMIVQPNQKCEEYTQKVIVKNTSPIRAKKEENKVTPRSPRKNIQSAIANKTAIFESSPNKTNNDPSLMSLAERKALFEKNKGNALIPKAAFAMPIPIHDKENKMKGKVGKCNTNKATSQLELNEKSSNSVLSSKTTVNDGSSIANTIAALISKKNTIGQEQISNNIKEQKQKDMQVLLNRFNKNKEASDVRSPVNNNPVPSQVNSNEKEAKVYTPDKDRRSGEKRTKKGDSPHVSAVLDDVKRIKVNQPKEGRLYPCQSDIETANETETEQTKSADENKSGEESFYSSEGESNTSFGRDILQIVCKNQSPQKRHILENKGDETGNSSDLDDILDDIDDYLDEAMRDEHTACSNGPTPPKLGKVLSEEHKNEISQSSHSFHYKNFSPKVNQHKSSQNSPARKNSPRDSSQLPTYVVDGENVLPLTHTVSFYRKQQTPVKTPVRQIIHQPQINEDAENETISSQNEIVSKKIQHLLEEINKQQMIISQTSQALNLCNSTLEFMGSTEQVEAEKLLLIATHRRQACSHEVQRLKVEGTTRPQGQHAQNVPLEKGTILIKNIVLPMKKEYVRALAAAGGKGHHVVCLIKCGEQVVSTQLVSTVASSSKNPDHDLCIPGTVKLDGIYSDFTVTFEVYCLQAQEEILPHEVKYHINRKGGNKLTPKKGKQESRLILPPKESPAGPQAVRSSTFALMGYVIFSIQSVNKTHWTLNKAPSMSPLEGKVDMKICCDLEVSVEHKGFLTMFEDISGFGAWHRRWSVLNGCTLSYWKYPDDERKKLPIETIDLRSSITKEVKPVSRDICARLHTFLIETQRDILPDDKESLTRLLQENKIIIRHLLSADTKEERIVWCQMFNKALTAIRMWGKN